MNHKQLLMDFYLKLLAIPATDSFRIKNQALYATVLIALSRQLGEDEEVIQRIFESMVMEDVKGSVGGYTPVIQCDGCGDYVEVGKSHFCTGKYMR